jgi:hypothetical protein
VCIYHVIMIKCRTGQCYKALLRNNKFSRHIVEVGLSRKCQHGVWVSTLGAGCHKYSSCDYDAVLVRYAAC